jgi:hypothetical protein
MSSSRAESLYKVQSKVMKELNVPVLDLYEAYYLSADRSSPGDGRHFDGQFNAFILSWFYPNSAVLFPGR